MVAVELDGDVIVSTGQVEQVFVVLTGSTVMNLMGGQVGQSLVMVVPISLWEVIVAGVLDSVVVEPGPVIVVRGQVEQGL